MVARYVIPEINGYLEGLRKSRKFVAENREYFERAREAVMSKIMENESAAAALEVTKSPMLAASSSNVPDFAAARSKRKAKS
jgi:limonene 1,2-monooxygenase